MMGSDGSTSCRVVPEDSVSCMKSDGVMLSSKVPKIGLDNSTMGSDGSNNCRVVTEDSVSCSKSDGVVWSSTVTEIELEIEWWGQMDLLAAECASRLC